VAVCVAALMPVKPTTRSRPKPRTRKAPAKGRTARKPKASVKKRAAKRKSAPPKTRKTKARPKHQEPVVSEAFPPGRQSAMAMMSTIVSRWTPDDPPPQNRTRGFTAAELTELSKPGRLHEEILRRIAALAETIAKLPTARPGIGHNRAPPLDDDEIGEIKNEIATLKMQPPVPTRPPPEAIEAESKLRKFGEKVLGWLAAAEVLKEAGHDAWAMFGEQLIALANAIAGWIASLL
jgi:hypothetical protein